MGQTFRVEPLSKMTYETLWPEQPIEIYRGHVWFKPSSGKSSSKNIIQMAFPTIIMWINPFGVVVVWTLIWFKTWIKASLWVLEDANRLQIDIWAWVLYNYLKTSSFSILTFSWEVASSKGLTVIGGCYCITLPLRITYYTSRAWISSTSRIKKNGVWTL